jgi:hypothetical protein
MEIFKISNYKNNIFSRQNNLLKNLKGDLNSLPEIEKDKKYGLIFKTISTTERNNNNLYKQYKIPNIKSQFVLVPKISNNHIHLDSSDLSIGEEEEKEDIKEINEIKNKQIQRKLSKRLSSANIRRVSSAEFMKPTYLKGTKPELLSSANPYIYSDKKFHPFSFMTGHHIYGFKKDKLKYPSPTFIENELWIRRPDLTKKGILKGMIINNKKGLVLVDETMSKKFKGIIGDLLGQILKACFGRKISLNVKLFEPKSILQTITNYWCFLPKFIPLANTINISPIERMKLIMAFGVSGLYLNAKQLKPFNPLITETFQGIFESDGDNNIENTEVYCEQISNYPTISRFLIRDSNIQMSGYYDLSVGFESFGSKLVSYTKGRTTITFKKINEEISYIMPDAKVLNAISEKDRSAYYINVMVFFDVKNNLKGVIKFGENKNMIHEIKGIIFKFIYPKDFKINYEHEKSKALNININNPTKNKEKIKVLDTLEGSWLGQVKSKNVVYWDIDIDSPYWIRPLKKCLPSDGRFREDLIWLFRSFYCSKNEDERLRYESLAQDWKLLIEKLQREEREMKEEKNKLREKKKK